MLRLTLASALLAFSACTCGSPPLTNNKEICDNREDDDGNGLTDCQDPACANDPACTLAGGEGEGEGAGEGEGIGGEGEGEGIGGEGEGEGAGDTCGDGVVGPSEDCDRNNLGGKNCVALGFTAGVLRCSADCTFDTSSCQAGEGEGEGAAGEGEGEGAAGEGEGEGEGTPDTTQADDLLNPTAVTNGLPFSGTVDINPVDDTAPGFVSTTTNDVDCFRFTITDEENVTVTADDGGDGSKCGSFDNTAGLDPAVALYADGETDPTNVIDQSNDGATNFCASLTDDLQAGTYIACVAKDPTALTTENPGSQNGVHVEITGSPVAPPGEDGGPLDAPVPATLPFTETLSVTDLPGAPDIDCYAIQVPTSGTLTLLTSDGNGGCPADGDTQIELHEPTGTHALIGLPQDDIDFPANPCSRLVAAVSAGDLEVCVARSQFATDANGVACSDPTSACNDITGVVFTGALNVGVFPPVLVNEVADPSDVSQTAKCSQDTDAASTATSCDSRFVSLFNPSADDDIYMLGAQVRVFANGNTATPLVVDIARGGIVPKQATFVIANNRKFTFTDGRVVSSFESDFGFPPDQLNGNVNGNGNDAYALFFGGSGAAGVEIDIFGNPADAANGATPPWNYHTGRGLRIGTTPATTFDITDWDIKLNAVIPDDF